MFGVQKWPELDKNELVSFYNEIKANKVLNLNWTNPGRIDPKLYFSAKNEKTTIESSDENSKESTINMNTSNTTNTNPLDKVVTSSAIDINKFDLFDDEDEVLETKKPSFNLRLIHSNARSRSSDNRVACMDKILNDMKRNYETEQKQIVSSETMMLVNDNFGEESINKSINEVDTALPENDTNKQQLDDKTIKEEKMDTECLVEPNLTKEPIIEESQVENSIKIESTSSETPLNDENEIKSMEIESIQNKDEQIETEVNLHENKENEKLDYIETSTPYAPPHSVNESDLPNEEMSEKRSDECVNTPLDHQIDSIKSNNYSSNELSDTTEEIETFTRKEPVNRVLEQPVTSTFNLTTTVQSLEKSDDLIKEVDSTTYKSQSPSPTRDDPTDVADITVNSNDNNLTTTNHDFTINETKSNLILTNMSETDKIETLQKEEEKEQVVTTTTSVLEEDDPLISQDISENSQHESTADVE